MKIKEMQRLSGKFKWSKVDEVQYDLDSSISCEYFVRGNYSILEKLLECWAKETKHWRADICYEIVGMLYSARELDEMKEPIVSGEEYPIRIVGIRENGVDHPEYVECRLNNKTLKHYKSVFMVTYSRKTCLSWDKHATYTMRLYKMVKTA